MMKGGDLYDLNYLTELFDGCILICRKIDGVCVFLDSAEG